MLKAKLVVVGGDAKAAEIRLKLPVVIGRGKEAGLTVPHSLVSRRHTEVFEREGRLFVRDLGSLNGTFVNNNRIKDAQPLDPNQLLTLGNITFRAVYEIAQPIGANATVIAADQETISFEESRTETIDENNIIIGVKDAVAAVSSLGNIISSDETVPVDSIDESSNGSKPTKQPVGNTPQSEDAAEEPVFEEATADQSSSDTDKVAISPDAFVFENGIDPASKSVSAGALDDLPTGQARASFLGDLDQGDGAKQPISQIDPVEINLGEEKESKVVEDSTLGSFLKKLPR